MDGIISIPDLKNNRCRPLFSKHSVQMLNDPDFIRDENNQLYQLKYSAGSVLDPIKKEFSYLFPDQLNKVQTEQDILDDNKIFDHNKLLEYISHDDIDKGINQSNEIINNKNLTPLEQLAAQKNSLLYSYLKKYKTLANNITQLSNSINSSSISPTARANLMNKKNNLKDNLNDLKNKAIPILHILDSRTRSIDNTIPESNFDVGNIIKTIQEKIGTVKLPPANTTNNIGSKIGSFINSITGGDDVTKKVTFDTSKNKYYSLPHVKDVDEFVCQKAKDDSSILNKYPIGQFKNDLFKSTIPESSNKMNKYQIIGSLDTNTLENTLNKLSGCINKIPDNTNDFNTSKQFFEDLKSNLDLMCNFYKDCSSYNDYINKSINCDENDISKTINKVKDCDDKFDAHSQLFENKVNSMKDKMTLISQDIFSSYKNLKDSLLNKKESEDKKTLNNLFNQLENCLSGYSSSNKKSCTTDSSLNKKLCTIDYSCLNKENNDTCSNDYDSVASSNIYVNDDTCSNDYDSVYSYNSGDYDDFSEDGNNISIDQFLPNRYLFGGPGPVIGTEIKDYPWYTTPSIITDSITSKDNIETNFDFFDSAFGQNINETRISEARPPIEIN